MGLIVAYAFEPQQELNYARNRGIEESDSRYFCCVDDDILVDSNWIAALYRALDTQGADAVGGRIHLDPEIKLPLDNTGCSGLSRLPGLRRTIFHDG